MDKARLLTLILQALEADRDIISQQLTASHEAATHSESKAENKYDTRGLEAAYLADGQRRRLHEIELALAAYRALTPVAMPDGIRVGALIELTTPTASRWLFLGPDAAGLKVRLDGQEVLVISPRAPLGQALLGREEGDEVAVTVEGKVHRREIVAVH